MSTRTLLRVAAVGVVVVGGAAVYVHAHRFDGGPLRDPSWGGIGGETRIGHAIAFTEILLENKGGKTLTLQRVVPRGLRPGTRVHMWAPPRGTHVDDEGFPFPPRGFPRSALREATGLNIPPHTRDFQLIAEVLATHPGCAGFDGLDIDYSAGFRKYRRVAGDLYYHAATPGARACGT